jgi:hypothetical protein
VPVLGEWLSVARGFISRFSGLPANRQTRREKLEAAEHVQLGKLDGTLISVI